MHETAMKPPVASRMHRRDKVEPEAEQAKHEPEVHAQRPQRQRGRTADQKGDADLPSHAVTCRHMPLHADQEGGRERERAAVPTGGFGRLLADRRGGFTLPRM